MESSRRYLVAVVSLAVLAVVFGLAGTVAPPLAEPDSPKQEASSSSSGSLTHFANPPTYDSGWVDITSKAGQYVYLEHGLNTTNVVVDVTGKRSLYSIGTFEWSRSFGGDQEDWGYSVIQTKDDGYAIVGSTGSFGAGAGDAWLVKTDSAGNMLWSNTYGGTNVDAAWSVVQTSDGGYAIGGWSYSLGNAYWLVKTDSTGSAQWNKTYGAAGSTSIAYSVVQTNDGGYALAGGTIPFGAVYADAWLVKTDSDGNMQWNKTYGGADDDWARSVIQASDGGYAVTGYTNSSGAGMYDSWLIKTDVNGNSQWSCTYGGLDDDRAWSVVQTRDGEYALAGSTSSLGVGGDFWLITIDEVGNAVWNRTYGGSGKDEARSLIATSDGGYALAGLTDSYGAGSYDFWLVKTDYTGDALWNRTYGKSSYRGDFAYCVAQTKDGGYAIGGTIDNLYSSSYDFWLVKVRDDMHLEHQRNLGGTDYMQGWSRTYDGRFAYSIVKTSDRGYAMAGLKSSGIGPPYDYDFWWAKTDSYGTLQWSRTYGPSGYDDIAYSMVQTSDGGYALAGYTDSYGAGASDFWLVKTDSAGNMQWSQTYGGAYDDWGWSVIQTGDGGYAMAGHTWSYGAGGADMWLVKTDSMGNLQWQRTYGGTLNDVAYSLVQTSDGGYALAGVTTSSGSVDFWLVKTDSDGNMQWNKTYRRSLLTVAYSVIQTNDGGFALAGKTNPVGDNYDFWLVKTGPTGNMEWNQTYGGAAVELAYSLIQTNDGGYALAGETSSYGAGDSDFWLVKTDSAGNMQWSQTYGGTSSDRARSLVQTGDGGYILAGDTGSFGEGAWLVKTDNENGLSWMGLTNKTITLYRGKTDSYWNYVRVRIWTIREPSWIYGDINMDGAVDGKDLYILGRNYGKSFSLLSLSGIIAIAGIRTVKKRRQSKQPSCTS